ncbi:prolyl oligopeptidase [Meira miltonrushii]|uniref:Prolyl oligopeptidase n=1 Tax=Meira miltonrushii TaxID=1280837 RepID=A0A316V6R7_9BASI|nr:prolyl oligopeptidase [Meira miltonrushii]PWN33216.1 prolyl oligopeptidase [Meira miltonrushii]
MTHVNSTATRIVYPKVHQVNKTWSYRSAKAKGNVSYADPYFWLEGDASNPGIQSFIKDQSKVTDQYMQGCRGKATIIKSIKDASNYDQYGRMSLVTSNKGNTSFYLYSFFGSEGQAPIWYIASIAEFQNAKKNAFEKPAGKPFLDETLLSSDGSASIVLWSVSPDGSTFGYLLANSESAGSWYFRKFDSPLLTAKTFPAAGEGRLKDTFQSSIDMISWIPDQKGIFYLTSSDSSGGTNTDLGYKVRYHALRTDNANDLTVFDSKDELRQD